MANTATVYPDDVSGVEVSEDMIAAGVEVLATRSFNLLDNYEYPEIARQIFEAMAIQA